PPRPRLRPRHGPRAQAPGHGPPQRRRNRSARPPRLPLRGASAGAGGRRAERRARGGRSLRPGDVQRAGRGRRGDRERGAGRRHSRGAQAGAGRSSRAAAAARERRGAAAGGGSAHALLLPAGGGRRARRVRAGDAGARRSPHRPGQRDPARAGDRSGRRGAAHLRGAGVRPGAGRGAARAAALHPRGARPHPRGRGAHVIRRGVLARFRDRLPVTDRTPALTLGEGDTPLVAAPPLAREVGCAELWLKVEGQNPTGSFKDRGMVVAVAKASEAGAKLAVCASTGNTSASAAAYCATAGITCRVVVPEGKVALGKLAQALAHGARIVVLRGNFDTALSAVRALTARGGIALLNSVNPYRLEGQKTAAFEIVESLGGPPSGLALPVGNAGNISAYWRGFVELGMQLPIYGIQAAGAAPLVSGAPVDHPETLATAIRIGNPASWTLAVQAQRESGGQFAAVPDEELVAACKRLAAG